MASKAVIRLEKRLLGDREYVHPKNVPQDFIEGVPSLSDKEARQFSFLRAINALANPADKAVQEKAGYEFEISRAYADKKGREPQGILIPPEILRQDAPVRPDVLKRDFNLTTGAGSNLRATNLLAGSFIEKIV